MTALEPWHGADLSSVFSMPTPQGGADAGNPQEQRGATACAMDASNEDGSCSKAAETKQENHDASADNLLKGAAGCAGLVQSCCHDSCGLSVGPIAAIIGGSQHSDRGVLGKCKQPQKKRKGHPSTTKKPVLKLDPATKEIVGRFGSLTEAAGGFVCREWYWW
jgi:hypothetical protein